MWVFFSEEEEEEEEDVVEEDELQLQMPVKIGVKKQRKLEEKQAKKAQREVSSISEQS